MSLEEVPAPRKIVFFTEPPLIDLEVATWNGTPLTCETSVVTRTRQERPFVFSYNIASLDGRLGPFVIPDHAWYSQPPMGPGGIEVDTSDHDLQLTTADTQWPIAALPEAPARTPVEERGLGETPSDHGLAEISTTSRPLFAIVDSRGRLPARAFGGDKEPKRAEGLLVMLVASATPGEYLAFLRASGIPYLVCGEIRVDLAVALHRLHGEFGIRRVLSDGGGKLNAALLHDGLLDEVWIDFRPVLVGRSECASLFDGPPISPDYGLHPLRAIEVRIREDGGISARYEVTLTDN